MLGSVTRKKVCKPEAPSETAASSSSVPCPASAESARARRTERSRRWSPARCRAARRGSDVVALQPRPQTALRAEQQHVDQARDHRATENGRSISVISRVLPRKSNLAIAQAAITPNTRLSGRQSPRPAASAGSPTAHPDRTAREIGAEPLEKACANTTTSGSTRNKVRKISAIAMMTSDQPRLGPTDRRARTSDCGAVRGCIQTSAVMRGNPGSPPSAAGD